MKEHDTVDQIAEAFRKVLGEGEYPNDQRVVLIKRIPIICQDILNIKSDINWIKWLTLGLVGGVGAIFTAIVVVALTK